MTTVSSLCLRSFPISLQIENIKASKTQRGTRNVQGCAASLENQKTDAFNPAVYGLGTDTCRSWSFVGGSKLIAKPKFPKNVLCQKGNGVYASWFVNSQIASTAFTLGTVAVLPFYSLMVLAPKAELFEYELDEVERARLVKDFDASMTRRSMRSNVPYVVLGFLYAYLLYLSWTPETMRLIFASKYWLPELPAILKMFSSEMTLASAWIHLLVVDLFAARQVYKDGIENEIETRLSVSLCLFFCPVGILIHVITKAFARSASTSNHCL